jgi:hypothetical protein
MPARILSNHDTCAFHEAAHALVALSLGGSCKRLWFDQSGNGGACIAVPSHWTRAVVHAAGPIGHIYKDPDADRGAFEGDERELRKEVKAHLGSSASGNAINDGIAAAISEACQRLLHPTKICAVQHLADQLRNSPRGQRCELAGRPLTDAMELAQAVRPDRIAFVTIISQIDGLMVRSDVGGPFREALLAAREAARSDLESWQAGLQQQTGR